MQCGCVCMLQMLKKSYADTYALQAQLIPSVWNTITLRTDSSESPHREVSDIWVRYNPIEHFDGDMMKFNSEHDSQWYPVADQIPEAKRLAEQIAVDYSADRLGAVLINKIP